MFADIIRKATETEWSELQEIPTFLYLWVLWFKNSLYMLYLSGFFIHCLLEEVHVMGSFGRWHRGLEGCGVVGWCDACGVWGVVSWGSSSFLSMSVFCYPVIGWCLRETSSEEEWLLAHWCLLGRIRTQRGSGGDGGRSWFPEAGRWWLLLSQLGLALCSAGKWNGLLHLWKAPQQVSQPEGLSQPRGKKGTRDLSNILYLHFLKPLYSYDENHSTNSLVSLMPLLQLGELEQYLHCIQMHTWS